MKTMIIDNECTAVKLISRVFGEVQEFKLLDNYTDTTTVEEVIEQTPDVVFIEVELKNHSGIELAQQIKNQYEHVNIILMSEKKEYAVKAYEIEAIDYVMKPLKKGRLHITLERLQGLLENEKQEFMVCGFQNLRFKNSDTDEDIPAKWRTKKTKELFAYLLYYQNIPVRKDLILDIIWPHVDTEKGQALLYSAIYQIRRTLNEINFPIEIVNDANMYTLKLNQVKYDINEWELAMDQLPPLNKNNLPEHIRVIKMYQGDYLYELNYAWAEHERGMLHSIWIYQIQKVANYLKTNEQFMDIIRIYRYIIEVSPLYEAAYFELMKLANEIDDKEIIMHYYHKLTFMLDEELGVKPDKKIQNWYKYWLEKIALRDE